MTHNCYLFYDSQSKKYLQSNLINADRQYTKLDEIGLEEFQLEQNCEKSSCIHDGVIVRKRAINFAVPYAMLVISCIQIVFHLCDSQLLFDDLSFIPADRKQVWRYLTYMFIHANFAHLVSNVILQLVAGILLEGHQGVRKTLLVYFVGGFCGALAWIDIDTTIVGSSCGAYALYFSQIPQLLLNLSTLSFMKVRATSLIFSVVAAISYETFLLLNYKESMYEIAFSSHAVGLLAGITIGFTLYEQHFKKVRWTFSFILFYGVITGILYNIFTKR